MDEAAILAAIAAHPAEDTPRLAYADWLDEHAGELPDPAAARTRAEFIRVQCEIKRLETLSRAEQNRHVELYRRQEAIITDHRRDLLGPLGDALHERDVVFDRGFVAELTLDAQLFLKHAEAICLLHPTPRIRVTEAGRELDSIFHRPELGLVETLSTGSPGGRFYRFTSSHPGGLAGGLAGCPYLDRLTALELGEAGIGDAGLNRLAHSPNLAGLTNLDLSYNEISDDGVRLLVASPLWPRLTYLVLGANPLSDVAAEALANAAGTSRLEYLNLKFTGLTTDGHRLLLRKFPRRTKLDLF